MQQGAVPFLLVRVLSSLELAWLSTFWVGLIIRMQRTNKGLIQQITRLRHDAYSFRCGMS